MVWGLTTKSIDAGVKGVEEGWRPRQTTTRTGNGKGRCRSFASLQDDNVGGLKDDNVRGWRRELKARRYSLFERWILFCAGMNCFRRIGHGLQHVDCFGEVIDEESERLGEMAEIFFGELAKEVVIDDQPLRGDSLNVRFGFPGQAQQDASPVAWILSLLDPAAALKSACFKRDESSGDMKMLRDTGDVYPSGPLMLSDDHHDVVLRGRKAGQGCKVGSCYFQRRAQYREIVEQLPEAKVRNAVIVE